LNSGEQQTYALDRAATGTGYIYIILSISNASDCNRVGLNEFEFDYFIPIEHVPGVLTFLWLDIPAKCGPRRSVPLHCGCQPEIAQTIFSWHVSVRTAMWQRMWFVALDLVLMVSSRALPLEH